MPLNTCTPWTRQPRMRPLRVRASGACGSADAAPTLPPGRAPLNASALSAPPCRKRRRPWSSGAVDAAARSAGGRVAGVVMRGGVRRQAPAATGEGPRRQRKGSAGCSAACLWRAPRRAARCGPGSRARSWRCGRRQRSDACYCFGAAGGIGASAAASPCTLRIHASASVGQAASGRPAMPRVPKPWPPCANKCNSAGTPA